MNVEIHSTANNNRCSNSRSSNVIIHTSLHSIYNSRHFSIKIITDHCFTCGTNISIALYHDSFLFLYPLRNCFKSDWLNFKNICQLIRSVHNNGIKISLCEKCETCTEFPSKTFRPHVQYKHIIY